MIQHVAELDSEAQTKRLLTANPTQVAFILNNPTELKNCPCCGGLLAGYIQEFPHSGRKIPQVTCWNDECQLYGFTHSPDSLIQLAKTKKE